MLLSQVLKLEMYHTNVCFTVCTKLSFNNKHYINALKTVKTTLTYLINYIPYQRNVQIITFHKHYNTLLTNTSPHSAIPWWRPPWALSNQKYDPAQIIPRQYHATTVRGPVSSQSIWCMLNVFYYLDCGCGASFIPNTLFPFRIPNSSKSVAHLGTVSWAVSLVYSAS